MHRDDPWRKELRQNVTGEIRFDEPAEKYTSMGVGGRIDALIFPNDLRELMETVGILKIHRIPHIPVGNWTNLIVRQGGYRGALICLKGFHRLEILRHEEGRIHVETGAGLSLSELVSLCAKEGFTGMEFCAGIPGSVGGAVRMNAGAFGGEIKDVILSLQLLDPDGGVRTVGRDSLLFSYRHLDMPEETIIIGAAFGLKPGNKEQISARIHEILLRRKEKHPLEFKSAGSIFKNPADIPAGRLIEKAGLKGLRIGDAEVSAKHGNFIVNRGRASAEEVITLIDLVKKRVWETTGRRLESEVRIIGEETISQ
jgi:UDP-N-acetylmuramate dehydrogenase